MLGIVLSVLCAAAVGGGIATFVQQRNQEELHQRLALVETKLTEMTAMSSMTKTKTGAGISSSSNRRLSDLTGEKSDPATPTQQPRTVKKYLAWLQRSDSDVSSVKKAATPFPPDNDLVCTRFHAWALESILRESEEVQNSYYVAASNRTVRLYLLKIAFSILLDTKHQN
jgi:hypothetical protein